nr:hypothetical protein [Tanacetum cinerariifolium]
MEPEDSLIIRNEDLSTIPEKESDEVIKSSVKDFVPIPSESEDTFGSDSEYDLSLCDDFSPIDVPEGKFVTFSNPLFCLNGDFTSSDDESLSDEDVLENSECKVSYDSNLDEPDFLVTPLFDECFNLGGDVDEIELLLRHDLFTLKMSVASILEGFTDEPPLEENDIKDGYYDSEEDIIYLEILVTYDTIPSLLFEMFLDHELKGLKDEPNDDDLKYMVKIFDPQIHEKFFSPTYVNFPFEDRHYLFFTYVIRIFLPYFTYQVDSPFLLSSRSEDTILTPVSSVFIFSAGSISSEWNFHKL